MGTRGIPARYGGFETFAEQISVRLVERGYRVTVYGRSFPGEELFSHAEYRGVQTQKTPTIRHKYGETVVHALSSFIHGIGKRFGNDRYDVVLLCNAANSPFVWLLRIIGYPVAINVDGIERKRAKWNAVGRAWYRLGEICSVIFATEVIADAEVIAAYYQETYHTKSTVIAYGAEAVRRAPGETLAKFSLHSQGYLLYVSRLEPENNALGVVEAYVRSGVSLPLVVVGDAPYANEYKERLHKSANAGVIFTGFQFGEAYQELQSNCYAYIQATEVGGTHPALIESMAYGNCVIANGTPENREVLGDAGLFYSKNNFEELAELMKKVVNDESTTADFRIKAAARAKERYQWDRIVDQYDVLFTRLAER